MCVCVCVCVCVSYILPDGSSRQSMVLTNIFDRLLYSEDNVANKNCNMLVCGDFKVVIITDFGQRQRYAYNAENKTYLPKNLQMPSLCRFS